MKCIYYAYNDCKFSKLQLSCPFQYLEKITNMLTLNYRLTIGKISLHKRETLLILRNAKQPVRAIKKKKPTHAHLYLVVLAKI